MAQDTPEVPREPQLPSEYPRAALGLVLFSYIRELTVPASVSVENGKNIRRNKYGVVLEEDRYGPPLTPGLCCLDADLPNKQGIEFIEKVTFSSAPRFPGAYTIDAAVLIQFNEDHPSNFTLFDTDDGEGLYLKRDTLLLYFDQNGNMSLHLRDGDDIEDEDEQRLKDKEFLDRIVRFPRGDILHVGDVSDYKRINYDPKNWQELLMQVFDRLSKAHPDQYPDFYEYWKNFGKAEQSAEDIVGIPTDLEDPPASGGFIRPRSKR